jgi:hypothetical protein
MTKPAKDRVRRGTQHLVSTRSGYQRATTNSLSERHVPDRVGWELQSIPPIHRFAGRPGLNVLVSDHHLDVIDRQVVEYQATPRELVRAGFVIDARDGDRRGETFAPTQLDCQGKQGRGVTATRERHRARGVR